MNIVEDENLVLLWKERYEKIDQLLAVNKQLLKEVINQKAVSALHALIRFKTREIIAALIYLWLLGGILFYAISNYTSASNYFIVSFSIIFLINIKGLTDYVKHIVLTNNIENSGSVAEVQQKLTQLQLSFLDHSRMMVWQLPFWTTFYLSDAWFPHSVGWGYVTFQILATASFTYTAYWLYKNLTAANADKEWIKTLLAGSGGNSILKAIDFYKEVENFKQFN